MITETDSDPWLLQESTVMNFGEKIALGILYIYFLLGRFGARSSTHKKLTFR